MIITLLVTLTFAYIYGEYLKGESIKSLSKSDAKQTSMLVFESLYSAMEKGWTKKDLEKIINRLNNVNKDLDINVDNINKFVDDWLNNKLKYLGQDDKKEEL